MEALNEIRATMEITENGYLIPNARLDQYRRHSSMAKLDSPAEDPRDDHHYEPLEPTKSRRKKGRTWRIFGEAKRRSRSLGPSVGQLIRRSVATSELDLEDHRTSKSKTTKHKLKLTDIVIVSPEMGGQEEPQFCSYRSRRMSSALPSPERSYSVDSEFFYERNSGGLASPLNRIPSIGSLAAASTLPRGGEGQPALPPRRRYSEVRVLPMQQSLDECALPSRTLSEPSPSPAAMEDELQLLRHRVEVLERRLAGELDTKDFKLLLDDTGESSTDDKSDRYASRLQISPDCRLNSSLRSSSTLGRSVSCDKDTATLTRRSRRVYCTNQHSTPDQAVINKHALSSSSLQGPQVSTGQSKYFVGTDVHFQRLHSTPSDDVFVDDASLLLQPSKSCPNVNSTSRDDTTRDHSVVQDPSMIKNIGSYKIEKTSGVLVLNKMEDPVVPLAKDRPSDVPSMLSDTVSLAAPGESTTDTVKEAGVGLDSASRIVEAMFRTREESLKREESVEQDGATEVQDDYVKRTKAKTKMAMELPFGKTNGTANGTVNRTATLPNGTLASPPLPSPQENADLGEFINLKIKIADTDIQKSVCFRKDERIVNMKQHILQCPDVELPDSRNHGFYMLPQNNKAGKFLDEERLISDYPIDQKRPYLEFRYKKRVYRQLNLDVTQLKKFHSKSNLKQFLDYVRNRQVDKINKMADKGLDPNFHEEATGETPLTIAVAMERSEDVLKALVNGGAHLDFRNRHGFTPVHRAVQKSNDKSLDILLDLGASPNSKDDRGLSPLYYSIVTDSETHVTELLLKDCAEVSPVDSQGWGLIHYACRYGRFRSLKLLLLYGSNLSLLNEAGNTPLHVSALYNQEDCALMMMDRGADSGAKNKANQTPFQVAILANNFDLAEVIRNHSGQTLDSAQDTPTFSKRRRWADYISHSQSLSQVRGQVFLEQSEEKYKPRSRMSLATIPGSPEKKSLSNGSAGGPGTKKAPMIHRRIKEAPKGRFYIAKQNYSAQEVGELSLHKGDHVEVMAIGEYNYWQGSVAHSMGWFPSYCVDEVSPKYRKSSSKLNLAEDVAITNSVPSFDGAERELNSDPRIACVQRGKKGFGFVLRGAKSPQGGAVSFTPTKDFPALQYLEHVDKSSPADRAGLKMGDFILEINGEDVIAAPHQYVVNLVVSSPDTIVIKVITVPNSKAYSWLKDGGGTLKRPGNSPNLPISTPATKSIAISSNDQNSNSPSIPVSTPTTRSISISSQEQHAVDELDKAIDSATTTPKYVSPASSRSSSIQEDEPKIASIRKRPIRHQLSQQHLEGIFQRQGSSSSETNLNAMPDDAFIQKPTVPAPSSSKFNTVARMSNTRASRQPSLDDYRSSPNRRDSGGSDSAVSSLRSSPASSNSYMTASTMSVTDSAVHLKTERTASDPSLAVDLKNVSPKSLQGTAKKPSPLPPTRSQSLLNLSIANSVSNSPVMRLAGDDTLPRRPRENGVSPSSSMIAVEIEVHRSASGNDSSDDSSSTGSFASAIALAAAKMEKKKESDEPKPPSTSAFDMAMAAKQNYSQVAVEGQNLNRNQNQNVESPSSTQVALQAAIAKRKQRIDSASETKSGDIEDRIRKYKQQDRAARPKTGQAAFLDAIAKRRSIVESQSPSSEEDSSSESMPSSPMSRIPSVKSSHAPKTSPVNNSRPSGNQIADAASAMQDKIASRPPIKEEKSRHKNVIRVSPRSKNDDSTDSSDGEVPPISVKNLKQSFEKSKKLSPRESKVLLLSPVKEDETLINAPIPPPPAFLETDASILTTNPEDVTLEDSMPNFDGLDKYRKDPHHTDIDILPPPPSFLEDGDQAKFRREQPFDTASVVSSVSSISTMSSYSTMSTDPSSNDGFEPIGEESQSNSNTLRSDISSSGSSSSTLTTTSMGETNDNWIKTAPPVATKPSKKSLVNDNDITNRVTNGNDNNNPSQGKSVSEWSVEDVADWLDQLQLGEYKESFTDNAISGEHLTSLGKDDLSELGVKRLGHRLTIIKALQKLQN